MKKTFVVLAVATLIAVPCFADSFTITYTYDAQHRLVSADYTEVQPDTHVTYQYDAANNINLIVAITDSHWLQSFQLWLSSVFSTSADSSKT